MSCVQSSTTEVKKWNSHCRQWDGASIPSHPKQEFHHLLQVWFLTKYFDIWKEKKKKKFSLSQELFTRWWRIGFWADEIHPLPARTPGWSGCSWRRASCGSHLTVSGTDRALLCEVWCKAPAEDFVTEVNLPASFQRTASWIKAIRFCISSDLPILLLHLSICL